MPGLVHGHLFSCAGQKHDACLPVSDIDPYTLGHLRPEVVRRLGQRDILGVPAGFTYPSEITGRLLTGDVAFFQQYHRDISLCQSQGGAHTNDASADNDYTR